MVFYKRMGDPNTAEGKAQLAAAVAPDARRQNQDSAPDYARRERPARQQTRIRSVFIALRERDYPVEYIVAPDEGHGYARPVNNMAVLAAAEKFLAKHLGGRYQESMTPEVASRLKEITVDVRTVTLPAKPLR